MEAAGAPLTTRSAAWPCLGVGTLGVGVGLAGAGRPSIWYDEAATLSAIRRPPDEILRLTSHQDAVHALYYLLAWTWSRGLGDGILPLRALSAVGLGVMAGLVVLVTDRLLSSRSAAVWAGVVAALIPGLMLLVHGIALLVAERRLVRPWVLASVATTLACLPLVWVVQGQSSQISWIHQPPIKVLSNVALRQVLMGQGQTHRAWDSTRWPPSDWARSS